MIRAGEQITYPDGRPYCKCIRDFHATDLMMNLVYHLDDYEDGAPVILPSTAIASVPFLRQSGLGYQICVNGEWR